MKSLILIAAFGACVLSVSSANIPSAPNADAPVKADVVTARGGGGGGWGSVGLGGGGGGGGGGGAGGGWGGVQGGGWAPGSEIFSGPGPVFFAPIIAIALIAALWVAAYNTLRSGPPKVGFGAGAQGGPAGWGQPAAGGWGAPVAAGGWGQASGYPEYDIAAAGSSPQAAAVATAVQQTVAATGSRSLNDLTHRVLTSIERQEQAQRS